MRAVKHDGCPTAFVPAAAIDDVRLPDDLASDRDFDLNHTLADDEHTITLGEYWDARNAAPAEPTDCSPAKRQPLAVADPYDTFTVDAEIQIDRLGLSRFTAADIGALIGVSDQVIRYRMRRAALPDPRWPSVKDGRSSWTPHMWARSQVVSIFAAHLRLAFGSEVESA